MIPGTKRRRVHRIQVPARKRIPDLLEQRCPTRSAVFSVRLMMAAQEFERIKHNFKTSHKRPPGPSADKCRGEYSRTNQNTGSRQFCESSKPASDHLLNIHTSAGFEAPISGWF